MVFLPPVGEGVLGTPHMNKIKPFLFSTLIFLVACFASFWLYLFLVPVVTDNDATFYLKPGASKKTVLAELSQQHIIPHPFLLSLYVFSQRSALLKTGEYRFPKGSTTLSIWKQITTGAGLLYHPFTIIPGWSFHQLRQALLQTEGLRHLIVGWDDKQIMTSLGHPERAPEGEFFPETYYYTKGISDLVILKRAFDLMQLKLNEAWETRASSLPYQDAYQALIAASLIEKEAYRSGERVVIAGVLVNRLQKDMLLQFDPTVIYGLGPRYDGKIHRENLQEDNAYNTYVHKGLPPTPIAMPSMASIQAALHPQVHAYLYFVAKGDGSHQFSTTLAQHNIAVSTSGPAFISTFPKSHTGYFNESKIKNYLYRLLDKT